MKDNERTQKTLSHLRNCGFRAQKVEYWQWYALVIDEGRKAWSQHKNGMPGVRKDLFQFIDIIAMREDYGIVGVQSTSKGSRYAHRAGIFANEDAIIWLRSKGRILLYCWSQEQKNPTGPKIFWTPHVEEITLSMIRLNEGPF